MIEAREAMIAYEALYQKLENIHFRSLEDFNLAKALSTFLPSLYISKNYDKEWFLRAAWHIVHANYEYDFSKLQEGKTLFFISEDIRADFMLMFEKMRSCAKSTDVLCGVHTRGKSLRWSWVKKIPAMFSWDRQMSRAGIPFKNRFSLIGEMLEIALWADLVRKNQEILLKHNALVSANDAMPRDSILVQFFNQNGLPTATMQHGHYNATRYIDEKRHEIGSAYRASVSDIFLAWGEYSCLEAKASGIPEENLRIVGCPKYIDVVFNYEKPETGCFGVILCGTSEYDDVDSSLLDCAEKVYETTGMKYVVKPHPAVRDTAAQLVVGKKGVKRLCESTETVAEYAKTVEYSICAGSTVYAELLKMGYAAYRSNSSNVLDRYSRIEEGAFDSPERLLEMLEEGRKNPAHQKEVMDRINCMVFGGLNEKDAYKKVFEDLVLMKGNV